MLLLYTKLVYLKKKTKLLYIELSNRKNSFQLQCQHTKIYLRKLCWIILEICPCNSNIFWIHSPTSLIKLRTVWTRGVSVLKCIIGILICRTRYTTFPQQAKSELHSDVTKLQQVLPLTDNFTQFKQFLVRIKATKGQTQPRTAMPPVTTYQT